MCEELHKIQDNHILPLNRFLLILDPFSIAYERIGEQKKSAKYYIFIYEVKCGKFIYKNIYSFLEKYS